MKKRRTALRSAMATLMSVALSPFLNLARAQTAKEAIVWPVAVPNFHENCLQLLGLLAIQHELNGVVPARALTALFPLNPTTPGTIDRINSRGNVFFKSGQVSNQGAAGTYQFDDENVGRVSFRIPSRVSGICTGDSKELTIDFLEKRPSISFAKLPSILAGMPKNYDCVSMLLNDERVRITLQDPIKKQALILELVHQSGAKLFVNRASSGLNVMGMVAALRFVAPSSEVKCLNCQGGDCKPGSLPADTTYCVGYYAKDPKQECVIMSNEAAVKYNNNCSMSTDPGCKGRFTTYSCAYETSSAAANALNGELSTRCK